MNKKCRTLVSINLKMLECNIDERNCEFVGASTENLPPGVLYRVKATYKYNREDVDELSFDVGEIIQVIEYDDPEEQVTQVVLNSTDFEKLYLFIFLRRRVG
jgi:hypothetical protein